MESRATLPSGMPHSLATLWRVASHLGVAVSLALSLGCGDRHEPLPPDAPVVQRIDHVLMVSHQAEAVFSLFTDTLQCPVVWPMADHGGFASGGVSLGNVTLEIIQDSAPAEGATASRFTGMALEPVPLQACLPALTARGIPFGRPSAHRPDLFTTRWTTVGLPGVSSEAMNVFFCEYGPAIRKVLPERRRRARDDLQARGGGPLSLDEVREVVIAARDPSLTQTHWQALLHPTRPRTAGSWALGAGPAIRIEPGTKEPDHIATLVLQVRSLEQARTFLRTQGLLGSGESDRVSLATPDLGLATLHLVAPEPEDDAATTARD